MNNRKWMLWLVCCFCASALAANGGNPNAQQRQQQLDRANSYAETVISTMEGLLQGYDVSTLSSAFSQEITNLTNYANGVSGGGSGATPNPGNSNGSGASPQMVSPSQPKVSPATSPTGGFNVTPPPKDNDVSTVPNITGF